LNYVFSRVLDEVLAQPNIVFLLTKFITWRNRSAEGSWTRQNILKPVLSRSGFRIGATTTKEYQRIGKDPAFK
jgi:ATP-dependent Clp protease ATP-binding subunit ClpA